MEVWERIHRERYNKETGESLGVADIDRPVIDEEKRDWFAAHAPVGVQDALKMCGFSNVESVPNDSTRACLWTVMALARYEYADAMLKAKDEAR